MPYRKRFAGFKTHPNLEGTHAFLSPSNYHWLNYTLERLEERYTSVQAAQMGTRLHAFAAEAIELGMEFPDNGQTLNLYVNDAIRYGMKTEQTLFYSLNCYGQADAIGFEENDMFLRIHDFKSGTSPTSEKQLYVYAALFCLEYGFRPFEIDGQLRIYQSDEIRVYDIDRDFLAHVVDKILTFDRYIEEKRAEGSA